MGGQVTLIDDLGVLFLFLFFAVIGRQFGLWGSGMFVLVRWKLSSLTGGRFICKNGIN